MTCCFYGDAEQLRDQVAMPWPSDQAMRNPSCIPLPFVDNPESQLPLARPDSFAFPCHVVVLPTPIYVHGLQQES